MQSKTKESKFSLPHVPKLKGIMDKNKIDRKNACMKLYPDAKGGHIYCSISFPCAHWHFKFFFGRA